MGPSIVVCAVNNETLLLPSILFLFPSRLLISKTADRRPPYSALYPPFISSASLTASTIKFENKPPKCEGL